MAVGSAVKTIRWENSEGQVEQEMEMEMDSSSEEVEEEDDEYDDENEEGEGYYVDDEDAEISYTKPLKQKQKQKQRVPVNRVLPVAELPDDYDYSGEVLDGATFLALSNRANAQLPKATRVPAPFASSEAVLPTPQPVASGSRHPALPAESWTTVFPDHFRNYRNYMRSEWPPESRVPYPDHLPRRPSARVRGEVWVFINGLKRRLLHVEQGPDGQPIMDGQIKDKDKGKGKGKGKGKAMAKENRAKEDAEWGIGDGDSDGEVDMDEETDSDTDEDDEPQADLDLEIDDEEAAMNGPKKVWMKVQEEENESHRKHEPLVCVLQYYDTHQLIGIIELITTFVTEKLDLLSPFVLVPSTPESTTTPLPALYTRWLFACLILIDDQLDSQHMSTIRDLARCAMKVAAWRWIQAVTDKEVDASESASWGYKGKDERDKGECGLEETLGRCWLLVHAVVAGWNQKDLLEDLENMFR